MSLPEPRAGGGRLSFGAVACMVIGLLILVPSGLCTGTLGVVTLQSILANPSTSVSEAFSTLGMVLVIGGPFVAAGAALFYVGFTRPRLK